MLLLTHAYLVPSARLDRHNEIVRKLSEYLAGWQVGLELLVETSPKFRTLDEPDLRVVQVLRFVDAAHFDRVQREEVANTGYQKLLTELIELVNLPAQTYAGTHVPGYYRQVLKT